ncbi:XrtA/PEP-CTERM system TPR-repeat protein PrsT [Aestuariirhabdus litorea]|uniref:PEP-CTERM system TPR-repeat protein PrsT n=1 Tax=Aestuariirhabdus litorea TaxID=2528527 RepID=A0A3P3VQ49_9GAMM|nr:XrtA/PEP-CTERM system TPR-repeat protein PrsT [Aestuariirhabdus litorea]RRJ84574.1 PEP-CTERM system TPR-repeat protein PrsT [Aestuariirhabdus litorea]RWW97800.1 PEP-CTERM system TPR-repeat protein PrsT [Endozoicomonadaceae bacterium GTF-13]
MKPKYGGILVAMTLMVALPVFAKDYLQSARDYISEGNNPAAIIELKNYLAETPGSVEARELLATTELETGDVDAAIAAYEYLDQSDQLGPHKVVELANLYLVKRSPEKALALLSSRQPSPDTAALALLSKGNALLAQAMLVDAREAFNASMAKEPSPGATIGLAKILVAENKSNDARQLLDPLLEQDPNNLEALLLSAQIASLEKRYEDAIGTLEVLEKDNFGGSYVSLRKAGAMLASGDSQGAEQVLLSVIKSEPNNMQASFDLGRLYLARNEYAKSRSYFEKVLSRVPNHLPTMYLASIAHYQLGAKNQARDLLNRYLKHYPDNRTARTLLATIMLEQNDYQTVIALLENPQGDDPLMPMELLLIGKAYMGINRTEEGIRYLEQSRMGAADKLQVEEYLANAYLQAGNLKEAADSLDRLAAEDRPTFQSDKRLVSYYLQQGEVALAQSLVESRLKQFPEVSDYYYLKAEILEVSKEYSRARSEYKKVESGARERIPAQIGVARTLVKEGKIETAVEVLEPLLDVPEPDIRLSVYYASLQANRGEREKAEQQLIKAQPREGKRSQVSLALAALYLSSGDLDKSALNAGRALNKQPDSLLANQLMLQLAVKRAEGHNIDHYFSRLLTIDPNPIPVLQSYLGWLVSGKDYIRANEVLTRFEARADQANQPSIRLLRVMLDTETGDLSRAENTLATLEKEYPSEPEVIGARVRLWLQTGRDDRAFDHLEASYKRTGDSRYVSQTTALASNPTLSKKIIDLHRAALSKEPENISLNNNIAWLLMLKGDQSAERYARKAYAASGKSPEVMDTLGWILVRFGKPAEGLLLLRSAHEALPGNREIAYHYAAALPPDKAAEALALLEQILDGDKAFSEREAALKLMDKIKRESSN